MGTVPNIRERVTSPHINGWLEFCPYSTQSDFYKYRIQYPINLSPLKCHKVIAGRDVFKFHSRDNNRYLIKFIGSSQYLENNNSYLIQKIKMGSLIFEAKRVIESLVMSVGFGEINDRVFNEFGKYTKLDSSLVLNLDWTSNWTCPRNLYTLNISIL